MKGLKVFWRQLIKTNREYRLFIFLVCWLEFGIGGAIVVFLPLLFILDRPFRKYVLVANRSFVEKQEKEKQKTHINWPQAWEMLLFIIIGGWYYILSRVVFQLTRLPVFENFWRGKLWHYRYRHINKFVNTLENSCRKKILINGIDIDQYHYTLFVRFKPGVKPKKAGEMIEYGLKEYFGRMPGGVFIKLKRTKGEVLIPTELLSLQGETL